MHIEFVEISNFRKLLSVRVELTGRTTLFVGANNSGKTSAMVAMRRFLADSGAFSIYDFTLSHWPKINAIGNHWETLVQDGGTDMPALAEWQSIVPSMDVWLNVADHEIHHVAHLLPTLQWEGGLLGVRLRFEPKDPEALIKDYVAAITAARETIQAAKATSSKSTAAPRLWPHDMIAFLSRQLGSQFTVRGYVLDPTKVSGPVAGVAQPQSLPPDAEPIDRTPFHGLIRIDEISAQRGFGYEPASSEDATSAIRSRTQGLSQQLRSYYDKHLNPELRPDPSDLDALLAIENAQVTFDARLRAGFGDALKELESLGYPGVTNPKLVISTKIRPTDGLDHHAAVQYEVNTLSAGAPSAPLHLPEDYNGLGYQNLISMIFRLMGFRDAWMRVGKAKAEAEMSAGVDGALPPLHLVLVEEPEAHLHAQVQQVFIRRAYDVLRCHPDLGTSQSLSTQLVVSTHSSHVAHETDFSCLRYFRRLPPAQTGDVPVTTVINLSEVFGDTDDTQRFVKRYLLTTHCDLFFADAAILVEGPAERMLVPHFIRRDFPTLDQSYISILEIGGSHAHRLKPLIQHLGLLTLVVTDLDSSDTESGAAQPPARSQNQVTKNHTLRTWIPGLENVDDLLNLNEEGKIWQDGPHFSVRVAYQSPIMATINGGAEQEVLSSTFEDALVFENLDLFKALKGKGLIRKFRDAIESKHDAAALGKELFDHLREGKKAEFALDLLELENPYELKVPTYLRNGFTWLEAALKRKLDETVLREQESGQDPTGDADG